MPNLALGEDNFAEGGTTVNTNFNPGDFVKSWALQVRAEGGPPDNPADGIQGITYARYGVFGQGGTAGVCGQADIGVLGIGGGIGVSGTGSIGVSGTGDTTGVEATSAFGTALDASSDGGIAINAFINGTENDLPCLMVSTLGTGSAVIAHAEGGGYGVYGTSSSSQGVYGDSTQSNGVFGISVSAAGVVGVTSGDGQPGVQGTGNARDDEGQPSGIGVYGSGNNVGVWGQLDVANREGAGVYGVAPGDGTGIQAATDSGIGLYASAGTGGVAAQFYGNVQVDGDFTVVGAAKSAAVPHPDGSHRLLYCLESPESWFEDFGEGELRGGQAHVALDPDFAAVVHSAGYHVFLTPHGDSNGLYVAHRDAREFTVQEQRGGTSDITFSYRVVAKRRDLKAERLAKFQPRPRLHESSAPRRAPAPIQTPAAPKMPPRLKDRKNPE